MYIYDNCVRRGWGMGDWGGVVLREFYIVWEKKGRRIQQKIYYYHTALSLSRFWGPDYALGLLKVPSSNSSCMYVFIYVCYDTYYHRIIFFCYVVLIINIDSLSYFFFLFLLIFFLFLFMTCRSAEELLTETPPLPPPPNPPKQRVRLDDFI